MLAVMPRVAGLYLLLVMSACGETRSRRRHRWCQAPASDLRSRSQG
jgi:hypothetical protein